MQQQRRGHAARQRPIDRLVLIIERVDHHHLRRDRAGGLVHVIIQRDVRVRIDDARRQIFAAGIDHRRARRRSHILADGRDLAILDIDAAVLDIAVGDRHHDGVLDQDFIVRSGAGGCCAGNPRSSPRTGKCKANVVVTQRIVSNSRSEFQETQNVGIL